MPALPASAKVQGAHPVACDGAEELRLLDRVAAEDVAAFEILYRLYHPRLTRFLRGLLRQRALVEEVLDDTMLVAWRKAHTFDATSKVSTWLFAIAYRQALRALRCVDSVMEFEESAMASPQAGPEAQLQQQHLHARIGDALESLSPMHRVVIELTYYHGLSCREIAAITACPVATVKTRMFHARRKLRGLLGGDLEEQVR
jgi:RNA polymerase sigma factor (sigma-70 family)